MLRLGLSSCLALLPCCMLLCAVPGCGEKDMVPVFPVSGTVTYKGKPLEKASVTFTISGKPGQPPVVLGIGETDQDGKYSIKTYVYSNTKNGAVEGTHKVTIDKYIPPNGMSEEEFEKIGAREAAIMQKDGYVPPELVTPSRVRFMPKKYSDAASSELTANVKPEKNEINFDLD